MHHAHDLCISYVLADPSLSWASGIALGLTREHQSSLPCFIMGQQPSAPPPAEALATAIMQLPTKWVAALTDALALLRLRRARLAGEERDPPPERWAAAEPVQQLDLRVRRQDLRCGIPCASCLVGYTATAANVGTATIAV